MGPVWRGTCGDRASTCCIAAWMDFCSVSAGERRFSTSLSDAASALARAVKLLAAGFSWRFCSALSQISVSRPAGRPKSCQSCWASRAISSWVSVVIGMTVPPTHAANNGAEPQRGGAVEAERNEKRSLAVERGAGWQQAERVALLCRRKFADTEPINVEVELRSSAGSGSWVRLCRVAHPNASSC